MFCSLEQRLTWKRPLTDNLRFDLVPRIIPWRLTRCRCMQANVSLVNVRPPDLFWALSYSDTAHSFCRSTVFPFCLFPAGVVTANHLPPSSRILSILFSYASWLCGLFRCMFDSPLWSSPRPPGCQHQPQHRSSHSLSLEHVQNISVCSLCLHLPSYKHGTVPLMSSFLIPCICIPLWSTSQTHTRGQRSLQ